MRRLNPPIYILGAGQLRAGSQYDAKMTQHKDVVIETQDA